MSTFSKLLCGKSSALTIEDEFNINAEIRKDAADGEKWSEEDLQEMEELKSMNTS